MTETRKQIIEIIEPYMDKTENEGCLYLSDSKTIERIGVSDFDISDDGDKYIYTKSSFHYVVKILGHYDISAVLKYITNIHPYYDAITVNTNYFYIRKHSEDCEVFHNKPLHLYTPQEEDNLLELLQRIGHK